MMWPQINDFALQIYELFLQLDDTTVARTLDTSGIDAVIRGFTISCTNRGLRQYRFIGITLDVIVHFDTTTSRNTRCVKKQFLVTWTKQTSTPIAVEFGIPVFKQQSTD